MHGRRTSICMVLAAWAALGVGCAQRHPEGPTIASLHERPATRDESPSAVQDAREQAIAAYRRVAQGPGLAHIPLAQDKSRPQHHDGIMGL
jgi:hypothetical protein